MAFNAAALTTSSAGRNVISKMAEVLNSHAAEEFALEAAGMMIYILKKIKMIRIMVMIKYIFKMIVFSGLFFFGLANASNYCAEIIEFYGREVFIPERLGNIKLYKDSDGFHIFKDGEIYDVQNYFCDPLLRKMSNDQLMKFVGRDKPTIIIMTPEEFSQMNSNDLVEISGDAKDELISQLFSGGYISVNQMDDGEYILRAKMRLLGAGKDDDDKDFAIKASIMISLTFPQVVVVVAVGAAAVYGIYKLGSWMMQPSAAEPPPAKQARHAAAEPSVPDVAKDEVVIDMEPPPQSV
ncbi:MAG: hypothetical protein WCS92_03240 [Candidatus Babeliales bacterium]|jgi:hypothetical protein